MGLTKSEWDHNLYHIFVGIDLHILVLYVNDLFLTGGEKLIIGWKFNKSVEFKMKGINMMDYFLELEIW